MKKNSCETEAYCVNLFTPRNLLYTFLYAKTGHQYQLQANRDDYAFAKKKKTVIRLI